MERDKSPTPVRAQRKGRAKRRLTVVLFWLWFRWRPTPLFFCFIRSPLAASCERGYTMHKATHGLHSCWDCWGCQGAPLDLGRPTSVAPINLKTNSVLYRTFCFCNWPSAPYRYWQFYEVLLMSVRLKVAPERSGERSHSGPVCLSVCMRVKAWGMVRVQRRNESNVWLLRGGTHRYWTP